MFACWGEYFPIHGCILRYTTFLKCPLSCVHLNISSYFFEVVAGIFLGVFSISFLQVWRGLGFRWCKHGTKISFIRGSGITGARAFPFQELLEKWRLQRPAAGRSQLNIAPSGFAFARLLKKNRSLHQLASLVFCFPAVMCYWFRKKTILRFLYFEYHVHVRVLERGVRYE